MKQGNDLSWPQVVMAANAPMMTKAALVDGRTDVGVLPTGQVVGEIERAPHGRGAHRPDHGRGRPRARPPRRVAGTGTDRASIVARWIPSASGRRPAHPRSRTRTPSTGRPVDRAR